MTRPSVSVVMPFAGSSDAGRGALTSLAALRTRPGDELILADNSGVVEPTAGVHVVRATAEQSPAHARNAGAEQAHCDWILFLDADCVAPPELLDAYFAVPIADDVGALAGDVVPSPGAVTVAERYGVARSFLSQEAHLAHPYMPRAVAANLLVRRAAFEQLGGFYEGVRAAEDTDFSWRLQRAGWRLELRRQARVEHRYRARLKDLRAQWRGYAAGRAWLRRRYEGFEPEPAVRRAIERGWRRAFSRGGGGVGPGRSDSQPSTHGPRERAQYFALDALLAAEELAGFALSNRPRRDTVVRRSAENHEVVLVADRFPARGDPLVDFALTIRAVRVEARGRPDSPSTEVGRKLEVSYREDDGFFARVLATTWLALRHPARSARDMLAHTPGAPSLPALAPAALRLARMPSARVHALGGDEVKAIANRLAALTGRATERS